MSDLSKTTVPQESLLALLRKNNPFISHAVTDPWFNGFPDVASINQQAFEGIRVLIERKAADPRCPLAGMVLGEAGEGKSHLLRRILDACKKTMSSLFVFVKPLFHPKRPLHHLLQEIVYCLSTRSEGEACFSQFERLVAEIIRDYVRYRVTNVTKYPQDATPNNKLFLERFESDVFHVFDIEKVRAGLMEEILSDKVRPVSVEIIEKNAVNHIHALVPETSKQFLNVIFQYKTPEKRGLVRDWLQGKILDEDDCETLGVTPRTEISDETGEQEAREMILTLGALFARYRLPMVVCFDQLDEFVVKGELVPGFARMIDLLVNEAASMLPLAFLRWDVWYDHVGRPPMDISTKQRLESNVFRLSRCTHAEAKELVSSRMEQMFGRGTEETIAMEQWLLPLLESKFLGGSFSPREVIHLANKIITEASGDSRPKWPTVSESMAAEYQMACEAVAADFDAWDPDSEYLKRAAELFLTNRETVLSCKPGDNKYMTWTGTLQTPEAATVPYACFINTTRNASSVAAALNRCKTFLQEHPHGICTFVTDARCDFKPTWNVANERRREFESLGGSVVLLNQAAAVRWYGLVSLSWKIGSGDILLEGPQGPRSATHQDLAEFLKTEFSACGGSQGSPDESEGKFDRLIKKNGPVQAIAGMELASPQNFPPADLFLQAVFDCLAKSNFPLLSMENLMAKLHERGMNVTREWCLEQIGKNRNVLSLIPTGNGSMVKRAR